VVIKSRYRGRFPDPHQVKCSTDLQGPTRGMTEQYIAVLAVMVTALGIAVLLFLATPVRQPYGNPATWIPSV
jgi:hypothetical protein